MVSKVSLQRYLRGRRDIHKIRKADVVFVSYAKAGRTWVRTMISSLFQQRYGIPESELLEFDNFHRHDKAIPKIFFAATHYVWEASRLPEGQTEFDGRRIIFLKRDPRDVVVSYYFHSRNRINPKKLKKKRLPTNVQDMDLMEFVRDDRCGIRHIIDYMNRWQRVLPRTRDHLVIGYEDMRADAAPALGQIGRFLDHDFSEAEIRKAIDFASFDSLKEKEKGDFFANKRLSPRDPEQPASFKVRRGKVGGFHDYFDRDQIEFLNRTVSEELSPFFGYGGASQEEAGPIGHPEKISQPKS